MSTSPVFQEGPNRTGTSCALDCGAGIGRITKRLLLPLFRVVDMVDVTEDFLVKAKTYLGEEGKRVRNYFCCGLQDFSPEPQSYDVIWIQWVIGECAAVGTGSPRSWGWCSTGAGQRASSTPPGLAGPWDTTGKGHLLPPFVSTQYLLRPMGGSFVDISGTSNLLQSKNADKFFIKEGF